MCQNHMARIRTQVLACLFVYTYTICIQNMPLRFILSV